MKVHLRQHPGDLIPVRNWISQYESFRAKANGKVLFEDEDHKWFDRKILSTLHELIGWVRPINHWWVKFRTKTYVKVDYPDIWGADHTLGLLIVPVLKKLKQHKHGSPFVDPEDVPANLRPKAIPSDGSTDETHHERWEWVINEMIWAFEQSTIDWEDAYTHNVDQLEMIFTPIEGKKFSTLDMNRQKDPSKPPYFRDRIGIKAHHERMKNGRMLFAKYYESLWD